MTFLYNHELCQMTNVMVDDECDGRWWWMILDDDRRWSAVVQNLTKNNQILVYIAVLAEMSSVCHVTGKSEFPPLIADDVVEDGGWCLRMTVQDDTNDTVVSLKWVYFIPVEFLQSFKTLP